MNKVYPKAKIKFYKTGFSGFAVRERNLEYDYKDSKSTTIFQDEVTKRHKGFTRANRIRNRAV